MIDSLLRRSSPSTIEEGEFPAEVRSRRTNLTHLYYSHESRRPSCQVQVPKAVSKRFERIHTDRPEGLGKRGVERREEPSLLNKIINPGY